MDRPGGPRVYILATEEPVFFNRFLAMYMRQNRDQVIGVGLVKADPLRTKNQSKVSYLLALIILTGPLLFFLRGVRVLAFRVCRAIPGLAARNPFSLAVAARRLGIPVHTVDNVHDEGYLASLREQRVDVLINQAPVILRRSLLAIPTLGTINRHGGLLPRYRGRLAPFWAYLHGESHAGLSIHLVTEQIDGGEILVQRRLRIRRFDTVNTLIRRIVRETPPALAEAVAMLAGAEPAPRLPNPRSEASYFHSPRPRDAWRYRAVQLRRLLRGS